MMYFWLLATISANTSKTAVSPTINPTTHNPFHASATPTAIPPTPSRMLKITVATIVLVLAFKISVFLSSTVIGDHPGLISGAQPSRIALDRRVALHSTPPSIRLHRDRLAQHAADGD